MRAGGDLPQLLRHEWREIKRLPHDFPAQIDFEGGARSGGGCETTALLFNFTTDFRLCFADHGGG